MSTLNDEAEKIQEENTFPCDFCGQKFVRKRKWQKFCCEKCRNKGFWKTHQIVKKDEQ